MLSENQAKWMFDKLLNLFRIPVEEIPAEAERIRKLARNDEVVRRMCDVVIQEMKPDRYTGILTDYVRLVNQYGNVQDSDAWWQEMYRAVNSFRKAYSYDPYVQELADALCRELRRRTGIEKHTG